MNKKNLLLTVLSASALLVGCNQNGNNSSLSESVDPTVARKSAMAGFIKSIKKNNVTMSVTASDGTASITTKTYYMGGDAFVRDTGTAREGILANGDQGFFYFSLDDKDQFTWLGCQGLGNDITTYFVTPSNVFADDDMYAYFDYEGEGYTFTFNAKQMRKASSSYVSSYGAKGDGCLYYLCSLVAGDASYYSYVSSLSMDLDSDGSKAVLTMAVASGTDVVTYTATFSDFGSTSVKAVADYLSDPKDFAAPTAWSDESKEAIDTVFKTSEKDATGDIIFPTGIINGTFYDGALGYQSKDASGNTVFVPAGIQWQNYGSDLTSSYGKLLMSKGYVYAGDTDEDNSSDGYHHYYYTKEYSAQTDSTGAIDIQCDMYYYSRSKLFVCQIYFVQSPIYKTYSTVEDANKVITTINAVATYDVPSLATSDKLVGEIGVSDYTAIYSSQGYRYYYMFSIGLDSEASAKAYAEAYVASLSSSYADTKNYSFAEDGMVVYAVLNSQGTADALVGVSYGTSSDGGYGVSIVIAG